MHRNLQDDSNWHPWQGGRFLPGDSRATAGIQDRDPSGKLFFTIVAAFSQFEREIIRERVIAGLENARSKGKVLGRPRLGDSLIEKAKELRKQGMSYRQIGRELETPESTIRKRLSSVR
jgi:putative DNA-invertase from lambdoid prophage Rac